MLHNVFKDQVKTKSPFIFVPFANERDNLGRLLPKNSQTPQRQNQKKFIESSPFGRHFKISSMEN